MASPTRWTWVRVNSRSWWWTGRPGVLRFMGSQIAGHDWATELNRTEHFSKSELLIMRLPRIRMFLKLESLASGFLSLGNKLRKYLTYTHRVFFFFFFVFLIERGLLQSCCGKTLALWAMFYIIIWNLQLVEHFFSTVQRMFLGNHLNVVY